MMLKADGDIAIEASELNVEIHASRVLDLFNNGCY